MTRWRYTRRLPGGSRQRQEEGWQMHGHQNAPVPSVVTKKCMRLRGSVQQLSILANFGNRTYAEGMQVLLLLVGAVLGSIAA